MRARSRGAEAVLAADRAKTTGAGQLLPSRLSPTRAQHSCHQVRYCKDARRDQASLTYVYSLRGSTRFYSQRYTSWFIYPAHDVDYSCRYFSPRRGSRGFGGIDSWISWASTVPTQTNVKQLLLYLRI